MAGISNLRNDFEVILFPYLTQEFKTWLTQALKGIRRSSGFKTTSSENLKP